MDRQLKRFDLPKSKVEMSEDDKLDEFLKNNCIELLPFQKEIIVQMIMHRKIYICYPPDCGRTDVFKLVRLLFAEFERGKNDEDRGPRPEMECVEKVKS